MKHFLMQIMFSTITMLAVCACQSQDFNVTLNHTVLQLEVKDTEILEVIVEPGTTENVVWTSSHPEVATVTGGVVTAVSDGKAEITATVGEGSAMCTVYVIQEGGSYRGEYELVWEDNFDGAELNPDNWSYEEGTGSWGWGNNEKQYYTSRPENIRVKDGCLEIEARKEAYQGSQYTSARIKTKGKQEFVYGRMEARICLPSGGGLWPAFWMLSGKRGWPTGGEIDILEYVGNRPGKALSALHTRRGNGTNGQNWSSNHTYTGPGKLEGEFHVFGVEWLKDYQYNRDAMRFFIDDTVTATVLEGTEKFDFEQWPFSNEWDNSFFFIINMAIGGTLGGTINDNIFNEPIIMKVDWVRAYQKTMDKIE